MMETFRATIFLFAEAQRKLDEKSWTPFGDLLDTFLEHHGHLLDTFLDTFLETSNLARCRNVRFLGTSVDTFSGQVRAPQQHPKTSPYLSTSS